MLGTLSLKHKSLAAFCLIALVSVASGLISVRQATLMRATVDSALALQAQGIAFEQLDSRVREQALALKTFVLTGDRAQLANVRSMTAEIEAANAAFETLSLSPEAERLHDAAVAAWTDWRKLHMTAVIDFMRDPYTIDLARLEESSGENRHHLDAFLSAVDAAQASIGAELDAAEHLQSETASTVAIAVGSAAAIVLLITIVLGALNFRLMSRISRTMASMASGERVEAIAGADRQDELGAMARAANAFQQKLREIEQAEAARVAAEERAAAERTAMLARLRESFGQVVDAGVAGDFSKQIDARFDDETLNELAIGVNRLLASVDAGVTATSRVASRLAEGDLTVTMQGEFRGAFAKLQSDLNASLASLDRLVSEIVAGSHDMQEASQRIQNGAAQLSNRAESQASSLEETAATMEEMSATIRANAENAEQAKGFAGDASDRAQRGDQIVREAVDAMNQIERSSARVTEIIHVIDAIAFQTNLLALNAAVEAARAGDAGKGFAVVASEVRQLAQRAADAAKDITALISESSAQVGAGVDLVQRAGGSLSEIAEAVENVAAAVSEITAANREQAAGIEGISDAVSHMDQMTQQNAAMAEESANEARELAGTAEKLDQQVRFFKTSGAVSRADAPVTHAPKPVLIHQRPAATPKVEKAPEPEPAPYAQASGDWSSF